MISFSRKRNSRKEAGKTGSTARNWIDSGTRACAPTHPNGSCKTMHTLLGVSFFLSFLVPLNAATVTASKTNSTPVCVDASSGTQSVTFVPGVDIPVGAQITDVRISVQFEKKDASCGGGHAGGTPFNNEIHYRLTSPSSTQVEVISAGTFATDPYRGVVTFNLSDAFGALPSTMPAGGSYHPSGSFSSFAGENPNGTWSLFIEDTVGSDVLQHISYTLTIDACIPEPPPPAPGAPNLVDGSDSGASNTDNITNDTTPTFTGTVAAGSTVRLYEGAALRGTAIADGGGTYNVTSAALGNGSHTLTVTQDPGCSESPNSPGLVVTIDTIAPTVSVPDLIASFDHGVSNTDNLTDSSTAQYTGTAEAGVTVQLMEGAAVLASGLPVGTTWTLSAGPLSDGVHNLFARQTDLAGNIGNSGTLAVTIDTVRPFVTSINRQTPAGPITNAAAVTWRTTFNEPVIGGTVDLGDFTLIDVGNTLTGETLTGVAPVTTSTYDVTANTGTGDGDLRLALSAVGGVTDLAGNVNLAQFNSGQTYTIDKSPPTSPSTPDLAAASDSGASNTDNVTNDNTPQFDGTGPPNEFVDIFSDVSGPIGTGTITAGGTWSVTSGVTLPDGDHDITAVSRDAGGNTSAPSSALTVTIDTVIATPTIDLAAASDSGPSNTDNYTTDNTPEFTGSAEPDSTVVLSNGVTIASGTATGGSYDLTTTPLADGTHNVTATSTDLAGNSAGSTPLAVTIDTVAPSVTIDLNAASDNGFSNIDDITNDDTPQFDGTTSENNCTVALASSLDGPLGTPASPAGTWTQTTGTLSEGPHLMSATPTDLAGNTGTPALLPVLIDTTPPAEACGGELELVGPAVTSLPTATFAALFTEPVYNVTTSVFGFSGPGTVTDASPLTPPDISVTAEVTASGTGTGTLSYATPGSIFDVAGNAFADASGSTADVEFVDISAPQDGNRIAGSDNVLNDRYGVALALNGEILFVGAPSDDDAAPNGGVVFVLERDSTSSFTEVQKLTASDAANDDRFGESLAVSGNWAAIGAPYNDNPGSDSGTVYVFQRDLAGSWTQHSILTPSSNGTYYRFGHSVAISGRTIAVSSPLGRDLTIPGGGVYRSGIVTMFEYDSCADTWNETQILQASDATSNDNFGNAIALAGNRLIVGAPLDDDNGNSTGSVYVFTRLAGVWTETAKLNHTLPGRFDYFGQTVSMSEDSTLTIIGAPGRDNPGALNSGAAYVFERSGLTWNQTDELVASDATNYDAFGQSVGVSSSGLLGGNIVVGAYKDDTEQLDAGSAYLFSGGAGTFLEVDKVLPLSGDQGRSDNMGTAVTVFGETAVIGSPFGNDQTLGVPGSVNVGSAYVFRYGSP